MNKSLNTPFLGTGWSFPPTFIKAQGEIELVQEETDIQQSLHILLTTRPGERAMQPKYGCNLDIMLFEPMTTTLITRVNDLVKTAILYYEPRIDLKRINVNTDRIQEGVILIEIDYLIRRTNSRYNFVYPFYLEEGNNTSLLQ